MEEIENDVGYRDDELFGGDGETGLKNIISYETFELGNDDILDYCLKNFNLPDSIKNDISNTLNTDKSKIQKEQIDNLINRLLVSLSILEGKELTRGLWLCDSAEDVYNSYEVDMGEFDSFEDYEENITIYRKGLKIDDLGKDGSLYAYTEDEFNNKFIADMGED